MAKLSSKHKQFVAEYLIDLNAAQAAIRAGYSAISAKVTAHHLLQREDVAAAIQAAQGRRAERLELKADRVLLEIARLAFLDPRRLFNPDGTAKAVADLDDQTAAAIQGVDVREEFTGEGADRKRTAHVLKYRLAPKTPALELACRHLGILNDKLAFTDETDFGLGKLNADERDRIRNAIRDVLAGRAAKPGPSGQSGSTEPVPSVH